MATKLVPTVKTGYAFIASFALTGYADFRSVPNDCWETEIPLSSEIADAFHVGQRLIDGARCNVWQCQYCYVAQIAS